MGYFDYTWKTLLPIRLPATKPLPFFFHINVILERGVGLAVALPQPTADMKVSCDSGGRQARAYN